MGLNLFAKTHELITDKFLVRLVLLHLPELRYELQPGGSCLFLRLLILLPALPVNNGCLGFTGL